MAESRPLCRKRLRNSMFGTEGFTVEQTPSTTPRSTGLLYTTADLGFRLRQAGGPPSLGARAAPQLQCRMGEVFTRQPFSLA